jgi:uncharacterized membrane-anchored protein
MTTGELRRAGPAAGPRQAPGLRRAPSKVPEVTAYFWIAKVLTTGMGETTSDYLVHRMNPVIAVGLGGAALVASLTLQFSRRSCVTWVYWLAVVMVAIFGTMAADVVHIGLHIPYVVSTAVFAVTLALIFTAWYAVERTLSIHSICTWRREVFYWATVMATFALGTATGDLTAATMGLGFGVSGIMFAVVITIPAVAHWRLGLNGVVAFWLAYIVTRPLGASFADWLSVPASRGGLALGWGPVSLGTTVIIAGLVGYLMVSGKDRAAGIRPARRGSAGPAIPPDRRPWPEPRYQSPPGHPTAGHPAPGHPAPGRSGRGRHRATRH